MVQKHPGSQLQKMAFQVIRKVESVGFLIPIRGGVVQVTDGRITKVKYGALLGRAEGPMADPIGMFKRPEAGTRMFSQADREKQI